MNRAERRAREKEKKKDSNKKVEAMAWFRSLTPAKQTLIDSLVKIEARKENDSLLKAIDRCFSAAVFEAWNGKRCEVVFGEEKAKERYWELDEIYSEVHLLKVEKEIPM